MIKENVFIPRILLCGSREEFFARVGQRSFEIIGQVEFLGAANGHELDLIHEGKFLLNDKPTEYAELHKMLMGGVLILLSSTMTLSLIFCLEFLTDWVALVRKL